MSTNADTIETFKATVQVVNAYHEVLARTRKDQPIFLEEACKITGYAKSTVYGFISRKLIPHHKVAGRQRLFFYKSELLAWMEKSKQEVQL
jgi:excisionase family DNA binding protein